MKNYEKMVGNDFRRRQRTGQRPRRIWRTVDVLNDPKYMKVFRYKFRSSILAIYSKTKFGQAHTKQNNNNINQS